MIPRGSPEQRTQRLRELLGELRAAHEVGRASEGRSSGIANDRKRRLRREPRKTPAGGRARHTACPRETHGPPNRSKRERPGQGGPAIPRRIAFINEKGGSGKTTLVANVAAHLAGRHGRRTLAIDMDPQGQLGKVLGLEVRRPRRSAIELLVDSVLGDGPAGDDGPAEGGLPAEATRIPGLDLVVGNKALALFPAWTGDTDAGDATNRLSAALDARSGVDAYDFVLFDAPPSFGPLTLNVLRACSEVVVPCPLTFLALDGCAELMRTLEMVRRRYDHPALRVSMVVPTFYRRTRLANECLERLRTRFPETLSSSVIGYHVKLDEAQSRGRSIFEYAPRDRGAEAMAAVADELLARGEDTRAGAPTGRAASGDADRAPRPLRPVARAGLGDAP